MREVCVRMCTRLGEVRFSHTLSNSFFPPISVALKASSQSWFYLSCIPDASSSFCKSSSDTCCKFIHLRNVQEQPWLQKPSLSLQITHQVVQEESVLIAYILDNESGMPFFLVWPWQGHVLKEGGGEHTPLHTHGRRVSVFPARARFLTQQNFR